MGEEPAFDGVVAALDALVDGSAPGGAAALVRELAARGIDVAVGAGSGTGRREIERAGLAAAVRAYSDALPADLAALATRLGTEPRRTVALVRSREHLAQAREAGLGLVVACARSDEPHAPFLEGGAHLVTCGDEPDAVARLDAWFRAAEHRRPSALARLAEVRSALDGRGLAVFLDYDGTLTPIVARPELAVLDPRMRESLRRLAARHAVTVVSGREWRDVAALVGVPGLRCVGSHGFEIGGPDGRLAHEPARGLLPIAESTARELERRLAGIPGALVERKRVTVAAHYRLVDPAGVAEVERAVDEVVAGRPELRKTHGKKVFELRPAMDWHKGRAVEWVLGALGGDPVPLYVGDDVTDEDAFAAVEQGGFGVLVSEVPRPTRARFGLADVGEVAELLEALEALP